MSSREQERGNSRKRSRGNSRNDNRGNGRNQSSFKREAMNESSQENNRQHKYSKRHSHYSYNDNRNHIQSSQSNNNNSTPDSQSTEGSQETVPAVREIPGFYYDTEKKKYFKITPNHMLGSDHPFSQQSIKKKTEIEIKPTLDPIIKYRKPRCCPTMSNYGSLTSLLRDRTLGLVRDSRRKLFEAHSLLANDWKCINLSPCYKPFFMSNDLTTESQYCRIQIDSSCQYIYYGSANGDISMHQISYEPSILFASWNTLANTGRDMTSFHLTPDGHIVTTSLGDSNHPGKLHCFKLTGHPVDILSELFTISPKKTSVWTSSVAGNRIVMGADRMAIYAIRQSECISQTKLWTGSDVFSTAIDLQEGRNLVYCGCRNGKVQVFDLSIPSLSSSIGNDNRYGNNSNNKISSIFTGIGHKESSVQSMKLTSENYLVTGATNGEILAWDTRFISTNTINSKPGSFSKPIMDIRKSASSNYRHGAKAIFDINREETLLAAENIEGELSLWSLRTGSRVFDIKTNGMIKSLKFSHGPPGIWVVIGDQLKFWGAEGLK